jgi:diguanylate cyclase (GGDEF)-like protein
MSNRMRGRVVTAFVGAVIAAGASVLAIALAKTTLVQPLGHNGSVFGLFVILLIIGELKPLEWRSGPDGGGITATWTFSIGLVCLAPLGVALGIVALVSAALEMRSKKIARRIAFNVAQITLSLAAAEWVVAAFGKRDDIWNPSGPSFAWVVAVMLAGLSAILVNTALICSVLSLSHRRSIFAVARDALAPTWAIDLLLVAMAPVLVVMAVRSVVVIPMLLAVIAGIYVSAKSGMSHRYEATHDLLTGLPNRRMFYQQSELALSTARTRNRVVGIVVIDLNGFKEINDRLGHAVGDLALKHVATRLIEHCRSDDVIARLGGDEFAILLGNTTTLTAASSAATSIAAALQEPLEVDGVPMIVSGSVGLAVFPEHGDDIDTLLGHADAAMYQAKAGQLGVQVYDGELDRNGPTRLGLLGELRHALTNDHELFLMYQPKVDLKTSTISGVEALIRWNHPTRGLLTAGYFMPVAEQTELMDEITMMVIRQAATQAERWRKRGINVPIAVNISARNLSDYRFPEAVDQVLRQFEIPANGLEFEITENTVTADPARAEVILGKLKRLGVRISVDDFGTGYSSLAHLRSLQLDAIKIDRSFVKDLCTNNGDRMIVRCIIDLAANLNLTTIAEGVEDAETLQLLTDMGCTAAQGYFLGVPTDVDDIVQQILTRQVLTPVSAPEKVRP